MVAAGHSPRDWENRSVGGANAALLYWAQLGPAEQNVLKIARFAGVALKPVRMDGGGTGNAAWSMEIPARGCVLASAETLAQCAAALPRTDSWWPALTNMAAQILIYGFDPTPAFQNLLQTISSGRILRAEGTLPGGPFTV